MNKLTQDILKLPHTIQPLDIYQPNTIPSFKDLLIKIFLNLNTKDTLSCALTCKRFYSIARSDPIMNRLFYVRFFPGKKTPEQPLELNHGAKEIFKFLQLKENLKNESCKEKKLNIATLSTHFVDHFALLEQRNQLYTILDLNTLKQTSLSEEPHVFLDSVGQYAFFYFAKENLKKIYDLENLSSSPICKGDALKCLIKSSYFYTLNEDKNVLTFNFWDPTLKSVLKKPKCFFLIDTKEFLVTTHGLCGKYFFYHALRKQDNLFNSSDFHVAVYNIETDEYIDISDKGNFPDMYWPSFSQGLAPHICFYKDFLLTQCNTEIRRWDMKEKKWLEPIDIGSRIMKWGISDGYLFAASVEAEAKIIDINTGKLLLHCIKCIPSCYYLSLENGYFIEKNINRIYFLNIKTGKKSYYEAPLLESIDIENVKVMHSLCIIPVLRMNVQIINIMDLDKDSILYSYTTNNTKIKINAYWNNDSLCIIDNNYTTQLKVFNSDE